MTLSNLHGIAIDNIAHCFIESFRDYFVPMPLDPDYYKDRWAKSHVNFHYSYGLFKGDQLIGCILNIVEERHGHLTAFNAGTGVLPGFRGQSLSKKLYQHGLQDLKSRKVTRCELEVIQDNKIALQLYKSLGFKIIRDFRCYSGSLSEPAQNSSIKTVSDHHEIVNLTKHLQEHYSWDNQLSSLIHDSYDYYTVFFDSQLESYFIIKPDNGYIAQFDVLRDCQGSWSRLFTSIADIVEKVKINNVDEVRSDKIDAVESQGLKNTVNQFQMELIL